MRTIVNGRQYRIPGRPVVGICLDGCSQDYLDPALLMMPNLSRIIDQGTAGLVRTVVPSFTNPNNLSIVTGTTPDIHGICGNSYFDAISGQDVWMNDPSYLRASTILAGVRETGAIVRTVTVKEKLRRLLGKGLADEDSFSIEKAARQDPGLTVSGLKDAFPGVYDPAASAACLDVGLALLDRRRPDLMYLSTTDYIQHQYPPGHAEANGFLAGLDKRLGEFDRRGVILGLTADHGMNAKADSSGCARIVFLETVFEKAGLTGVRISLPICDPYLVHHGSLGSYALVYLSAEEASAAAEVLRRTPGIELVLSRDQAAARFSLPPERIGDLVVLADSETVLGRNPEWHDLSLLKQPLRSHGGLHESQVPMIVNHPLREEYALKLSSGTAKNWDLYDFLCNGLAD
jgi:phosphonoacetate hydrolase